MSAFFKNMYVYCKRSIEATVKSSEDNARYIACQRERAPYDPLGLYGQVNKRIR